MASVRDDYHRLADYFLVVGLGEEPVPLDKHEASEHYLKRKYKGDVVDRFPLRDYDDAPLPPGVPLFCGPNGFALSKDPGMPSFHYFCATHGDGDRTYGSCLTFYEPASQETLNRLKQAELGRRASAAFSRHRRHRKRSRRRHSMAPLATSLPLSASSSMSVEALRTEMTDTVDDELDVGAHNARGRSTTSLSDGPANNGSSKKPGASRSKSGGRAATPGSNGAGAGAGGGKLVRSRTDLKWQPRRMSVSSSGVSIGSAGSAGSQGVARMRTAYDDDEDDEDDEFGGSADLDEYGDLLPRSRSDMAVATAEDLAATLSSITDSLRASDDPFQSSRWHVPKCICVLSHHSFLHSFRQFLTTLWRHSLTASNVPLERLICNFMTEVATPPLGKLEVQYILDDQTIVFKQPPLNNPIAFTHFPSRTLFEFLCVENIELLLRCVLLERQVLLLSSQLSLLTIVAETAMSLLYPFEPRQVYIPLLPRALIDFLNAPMPFLIGTHVEWVSLDQLDEDVVVVNLDEDSIRCEHEPPPFPKRERSKLFAALEPLAPLYKTAEVRALPFQNQDAAFLCAPPPSEVDDALTEQQLEFREAEVQATFFRVFVSIFKNFREFLIFPSKEDPEPTSCFATEQFLAVQPAGSRKFLADLLATQAWQSFVELRTFPGCEEDYDVLFFDESIIAKKNRSLFQKKRKTPFISDTKYEITKTAVAPQPNVTGLDSDKTYRYEEWPRLDPTLYTPPRVDVAADRPHHGLSRQDSRRRENTKQAAESVIFSVWFMLFAEVVSEPGRGGSLEQGFLVLNRMHAENVHPEEFVFRLLVDACSSCGVPGRGIEVLALMREFNAAPSNALYTALLQGFISNGDASVGYEALAELRKPQLTNTSFESLVNKFSFGRSFQKHRVTSVVMKSKLFEHTFPDKTIVTENECPECQLMVTDDDIRKGWAGDENTYTTKCPQCGEKFVARLQVLPISSRYEEAQEDVVNCEYLPPAVLKKEVEALVTRFDGAYLASPQFRLDKVTHFWNLAWHFTYYRLPLDFVLKEVVISSEEETEGEAEVGVQVGVDAVEEVRLEDDEPSVAVVVEDVDEDVVDMVARSVGEGDGGT